MAGAKPKVAVAGRTRARGKATKTAKKKIDKIKTDVKKEG
jgi:hypothetical protein